MKKRYLLFLLLFAFLFACGESPVVDPPKEYRTVTYMLEGGEYKHDEVEVGSFASNYTVSKTGYTFDGWYYEDAPWDFDNKIEENIILDARFSKSSYNITFKYNDSEFSDEVVSVEYGSIVTLDNIPSKDGYSFYWDYFYEFEMPAQDLEIEGKWELVVKYEVEGNVAKVVGYDRDLTNINKIVVFDTYEGHPVTSIGDNAFYSCSMKEVVLPSSITEIGYGAFDSCNMLESISLPSNLYYIGHYAFQYCSSLEEIELPSSLVYMGQRIFDNCTNLKHIYLADGFLDLSSELLYDIPALEYNYNDNGLYLGSKTNPYLVFVKPRTQDEVSVTIAEGCQLIYENAFRNCSNLESVTLPSTLKEIGYGAFYDCIKLSNLEIPNSISKVGSYAFNGCSSLTKTTDEFYVTYVGNSTNSYLVLIDGANTTRNVTVNDGCRVIAGHSFAYNNVLENITFPANLITIGKSAFYGCTSLKSVNLPRALMKICDSAFSSCTSLSSVVMYDNVSVIERHAFSYCGALELIYVPASVKVMGEKVFYECTNLTIQTGGLQPLDTWRNNWNESNCPVVYGVNR